MSLVSNVLVNLLEPQDGCPRDAVGMKYDFLAVLNINPLSFSLTKGFELSNWLLLLAKFIVHYYMKPLGSPIFFIYYWNPNIYVT